MKRALTAVATVIALTLLTGCAVAAEDPPKHGVSGFDWAKKGLGFSAGVHLQTRPSWSRTLPSSMTNSGWMRDPAHDTETGVAYRNALTRAYATVERRTIPDQVATALNDRRLTEHMMKPSGYDKAHLQVVTLQLNDYDNSDGTPSVTFLGGFRRDARGGMTTTYARAFATQSTYLAFTVWEPLAVKDNVVLADGADWAAALSVRVPGAGGVQSSETKAHEGE